MEEIILIGAGGHSKVVIDAIKLQNNYKIKGLVDLKGNVGKKIFNIPIIGTDKQLKSYFNKGIRNCFITVGTVGTPALRIRLFSKAEKIGFKFPNILHPEAIISQSVKMGTGNYIALGVIINAGVQIGNNCIINTGAIIEHDCSIKDFVHIAPGSILNGGTEIGRCSHIGSGSTVIQYLKIGENTIVGAGSVVLNSIENSVIAYGSPCKVIKANKK